MRRKEFAAQSLQCYVTPMRSRYLFITAGLLFLIFAVLEFVRTDNYTAIVVNTLAAVIFLFLGVAPVFWKPKKREGPSHPNHHHPGSSEQPNHPNEPK